MDSDFLLSEIKKSGLNDAQFQINYLDTLSYTTKIENSSFSGKETKQVSSVSVTCIYKGRSADISLNSSKAMSLQDAIIKAYKLAKLFGSSDSQTKFYSSKNKSVQKVISSKSKPVDDKFIKAVQSAKKDKKVYSINSFLSEENLKMHTANSYGARADFEWSIVNMESSVVSKDGNDQGSGMEVSESKDTSSLNIEGNLSSAIAMSKSMLGARQAPTVYGKLLFDPKAAFDFINNIFAAINGEEILKKRSFLNKFKNKQIASSNFNLKELPIFGDSLYNRKFDDELVPTSKKYFIERGVLKNYLNDIYSSEKLKEKPLGNNFNLTLGGIRPSNAILEKGDYSLENMLKDMDKGIYLINTGDSPNFSTGDISSMVSIGYYVENGEIRFPVKETLVGGNMLQMLKGIIKIGNNVQNLGGIYSPSILIDNVKISGK